MIQRRELVKEKKAMAFSQMIILVLGTIAIAYALGQGMGEVSAVLDRNDERCLACGDSDCVLGPECGQCPQCGTPAAGFDCNKCMELQCAFPCPVLCKAQCPSASQPTTTPTPGLSLDKRIAELIASWAAKKGGEEAAKKLVGTVIGKIFATGTNIAFNIGIAQGIHWLLSSLPSLFSSLDPDLFNRLADGVSWGYGAGSSITALLITLFPSSASALAGLVGISVAAFTFLAPIVIGVVAGLIGGIIAFLTYKKQEQEVVIFNCYSWNPETGGSQCTKCGQSGAECSKYECQNLGQQCTFLDEEKICYWEKDDGKPPVISAWEDALLENYEYLPNTAVSPPDKGVIISYTKSSDSCAPPFSVVSFGVSLDKPARCKYSTERAASFEAMGDLFLANGRRDYNQAVSVRLESGEHELFVRCMGENGAQSSSFVFKYCISEEPDTTAPRVMMTDPINNMPIRSGETSFPVKVYIDKPSECRWSHSNTEFENMEGAMTCDSSTTEMNALMLYKCSGTLDGLTSSDNRFYFRCKSYPGRSESERFISEPYIYTLVGTQKLTIDSVGPAGTIKGSSDSVEVELTARTSAGYDAGKSVCEFNRRCFSNTGSAESYTPFVYPTGTEIYSVYSHSQILYLGAGTYTCSIRCSDLGGNTDTKTTTYTVEVDKTAPAVVRAYNDGNFLKLITNEPAECVYDILNCNYIFTDGTPMTDSSDGLSHTTSWNTRNNLYVKCMDNQGIQPGGCSITVRAVNIV